ncbi:MAG TPA: hypothetical protein PKH77_13465 [Anaerolineae bacterium]|nr:hypothetical protein [Anaerolineae bacterium]
MASPTTVPAFQVQEGQVFIVKKGTDVIGQVTRINPQAQSQTRKIARLGDTTKKVSYQPTEFTVSMEMYSEYDPKQLAILLAGTQKPGSGGWVGTEVLFLNPTIAAYDLLIDVYDAATDGSDTKVGTWTLDNYKPTSLNINIQADNPATITLNGEMENLTYTPTAGTGA